MLLYFQAGSANKFLSPMADPQTLDGKPNVKSIMAKFSSNPAEEVNMRHAKVAGQPSSITKTALEKFAQMENAGPAKPINFPKPAPMRPPLGTKPSLQNTSDKNLKPNSLKSSPVTSKVAALAQAASKEANERPSFPKPWTPKPTEGPKVGVQKPPCLTPQKTELKPHLGPKPGFLGESQESGPKPVFPQVTGVKEKLGLAAQENDPKPLIKPPSKPKLGLHATSNDEPSIKDPFLNRGSPGSIGIKSKINSFQSASEEKNDKTDSATGTFPPLKPSNLGNLSQALQKSYQPQNDEARPSFANNIFKCNIENLELSSNKFSSLPRVATTGPWANNSEKDEKGQTLPKRKAIPPPFKLGPAPQKPSRPPVVNLERFQKNNGEGSNKPHSMGAPPPLPPLLSVTQAGTPQPSPPAPSLPPPPPPGSHPSTQAPVLPQRNIKPRSQEIEENYDDVDFALEGSGNLDESQNSDGEMYEDLEDMRHTSKDEEKKKEKEERKKADQEKKEQKEKEKKEQDIRKKFKLVGPIEVIHRAQACTDFKGGKNDLAFKQGDQIEIIRITDNPEGKWLGRIRGSYGYIKTTMVDIDYDSLRRKPRPSISIQPKHPDSDQEVYDDVGEQDSISSGGQSATGGFPPPPPADDIYDGVEDDIDIPAKIPPAKQSGKDSGESDVYDDVEPTDFPPPPKELSIGLNTKSLSFGKARSDDRDSQKLKKMEKEERDFRKKFKYEGEIQVLYKTTISQAPSPKKRGSKDLPVKPGDSVEVIKNVDDTKVLCRNEEGKYGYVQRSCIMNEDEEIYDDIADGCIYDND
ncbi:FYN-binding protein 1 isoform X2 [Varanus komodoensis]|uniref:FYN-binding protein 1 isoform X2 n=1 Tax=Varanus komodoensis TaxID=61221 RepID=UPI001CF78EAF|nr:FYN-binding protein 1 isoform X2 [Varanus komodoensis]